LIYFVSRNQKKQTDVETDFEFETDVGFLQFLDFGLFLDFLEMPRGDPGSIWIPEINISYPLN